MHYQILIKKFVLTHNRSLDGLLDKLNSKNLREGNEEDILNSDLSDDEKKEFINNLPGVKKKGLSKVEIIISAVKFSHTNRSFALATTEGIYIYSLDASFQFSALQLDLDITNKSCEDALIEKSFLKSLVYSFYLNNNELINKVVNLIPYNQIVLITSKLPLNIIEPLLNYFAKKIETDRQVQLYLM